MSNDGHAATRTPYHLWTNGGPKVLVVRFCARDGSSSSKRLRNGQAIDGAEPFRYPLEVGVVAEAPDWDPAPVCGGGLHGWAWGMPLGDGADPNYSALWQVYAVAPADLVLVEGGKVKFRRGRLAYSGYWFGALAAVQAGQAAWIRHRTEGAPSSATGDRAASSATGDQAASSATGDRAASSATGFQAASSATGNRAASSATGFQAASSATGDQAASSATGFQAASSATGNRAASSATGFQAASSATGFQAASSATGDRAASSATGDQAASSGQRAAVVTGRDGRARSGEFGMIALAWWNDVAKRLEMRCARTGGDGLKHDTWYRLDAAGEFEEAPE